MDSEPSLAASVVAAIAALAAAVFTASYTKYKDRQERMRVVLFAPAEHFAEVASAALASLRHVTPPSLSADGSHGHRNAFLLLDTGCRQRRLQACSDAVDAVRSARARVRVVFHPDSAAAEHTRETLQQLRACLESAERYYVEHDGHRGSDLEGWKAGRAIGLRKAYKSHRRSAYDALDLFYDDTAERLKRPTRVPADTSTPAGPDFWETPAARADGGERASGEAVVRARSVVEAHKRLRAAGLEGYSEASTQRSSTTDQEFWSSTPMVSGLAVAFLADNGSGSVLWLKVPLALDAAQDLHVVAGPPPSKQATAAR